MLKMESFYQNWLEQNRRENEEARGTLNNLNNNPNLVTNEHLRSLPFQVTSNTAAAPIPSTSQQAPSVPTENSNNQEQALNVPTQTSTNQVQNMPRDLRNSIIYQNDKLQLYLEKGDHVHQIRFRLQDHLFYMKIRLLNPKEEPPLLRDIVEFLELAFNHVLKEIRRSYKQVSISST